VAANADAMERPTVMKSVLVTGASTGFGRSIAERLAARGYQVYAGARKREDLDALMRIPGVLAVQLDVTESADIDAVHDGLVEVVTRRGRSRAATVKA
jgi:NADP-dependent 3-hydroxy acid dehydrogenase YdfG